MSKKAFISIILLFTFSFVLVHNMIPHHHHDEVSEIGHHHHHDKQDHQDTDDGLFDLFSHFSHCTTAEFSSTHFYDFQKTQIAKQLIKSAGFVFRQLEIPLKPAPYHYTSLVVMRSYYSTQFLRGPPVLVS